MAAWRYEILLESFFLYFFSCFEQLFFFVSLRLVAFLMLGL